MENKSNIYIPISDILIELVVDEYMGRYRFTNIESVDINDIESYLSKYLAFETKVSDVEMKDGNYKLVVHYYDEDGQNRTIECESI